MRCAVVAELVEGLESRLTDLLSVEHDAVGQGGVLPKPAEGPQRVGGDQGPVSGLFEPLAKRVLQTDIRFDDHYRPAGFHAAERGIVRIARFAVRARAGQLSRRRPKVAQHGRRRLVTLLGIELHGLVDQDGHPDGDRVVEFSDRDDIEEPLLAEPLQPVAGLLQRRLPGQHVVKDAAQEKMSLRGSSLRTPVARFRAA